MYSNYIYMAVALGCAVPWVVRIFIKHWAVYAAICLVSIIAFNYFGYFPYSEKVLNQVIESGVLLQNEFWRVYLSWFLNGTVISSGVAFGMSVSSKRRPKK